MGPVYGEGSAPDPPRARRRFPPRSREVLPVAEIAIRAFVDVRERRSEPVALTAVHAREVIRRLGRSELVAVGVLVTRVAPFRAQGDVTRETVRAARSSPGAHV